jgi:hypothetical protein
VIIRDGTISYATLAVGQLVAERLVSRHLLVTQQKFWHFRHHFPTVHYSTEPEPMSSNFDLNLA